MACKNPLKAWYARELNPNGKRAITFQFKDAYVDMPIDLPCRKCIDCKLNYSKQWAIRCIKEAELHENNCFITLTYDDYHLPATGTLVLKHFQDFMKRLRKQYGKGIRFFHCGEYGEELNRPHYHAILFNHHFKDQTPWRTRDGITLYRSESLEKLWTYGYSSIGDCTYETAAYVARYVTKKFTNPDPEKVKYHYGDKKPEYVTMSRRPGIAYQYYKNFKSDLYPADNITIRKNMKAALPKYFDIQYALDNPKEMGIIKANRVRRAKAHPDNTPERQEVLHTIQKQNANRLTRGYEKGLT